jgi:hypothetical protein
LTSAIDEIQALLEETEPRKQDEPAEEPTREISATPEAEAEVEVFVPEGVVVDPALAELRARFLELDAMSRLHVP